MTSKNLSILMALCLAQLALAGGNLLKNADFEDAKSKAWEASGPGNATGGLTTGEAFEGKRSGFIRKLTDLESHAIALAQLVPCEPETEYFLSAWLKGNANFFTYFRDANGNYAGQSAATMVSNASWMPVVSRLKTAKSHHYIQLRLERYGRGVPSEAWIDNAILARADEVPPPPGPVADFTARLENGEVKLQWTAPKTTAKLLYLVIRSRYPDVMATGTPLAIVRDECVFVDQLPY